MIPVPFDRHTPAPRFPVIVSVPHAGRSYPEISDRLRVPVERLVSLEDRHVDLLATPLIAIGVTAIIARAPRLWIDLNRAENDLDSGMIAGGRRSHCPPSLKVRGGLGLIPRRIAGVPEIWRAPLSSADIADRIATCHRPYHAALAAMLDAARARFGGAILIDLHSMPPLDARNAARVVVGDRHGVTASPRIAAVAEAAIRGFGLNVAFNAPFAGGHIVSRHGVPAGNVHALQIEVDRTLYLDAALDMPGPGLAKTQRLIAALVDALAAEIDHRTLALAAE